MDKYNELLIQRSKLPSYLVDLLETKKEVLFVSAIKNDDMNVTESNYETSVCNLTGNPLKVDLSILPTDITVLERDSKEEKHVPISLRKARKFINNYSEEGEPDTIVCLCDGNDEMHTVILYLSQIEDNFIRMEAFAGGTETDLENNFEALLDSHIQNVGVGPHKVDVQVMCLHDLYGYKLFNYHLNEYCENIGSIQVESTWNSLQSSIPEHGATLKLMLQVVVGHEDSVVYNLYQELQFLQHCLNELSNNETLELVILSSEPTDILDLYDSISNILRSVQVIKLPVVSQENSVNYNKETNVTDDLWNILKCCRTVNDLTKCFQKLFEIIANEPLKIQMMEDDRSTMVGRVIHDIYSGRMLIPYLSAKQCLELFTELGMQKLKKSYFMIIKSFNFQMTKDLQDKWNTLPALPLQSGRCTINGLNVLHGVAQAKFLFQIHNAVEFLLLIKEKCSFSQGVLTSVLKNVFNKYIMNTFPESFYNNTKQLQDITVPICYADIKDNVLLSDCIPNKWKIRLTSNLKNSSVFTTFYYTRKPIFPSAVYKYDDINLTMKIEDPIFYVTRLETFSDKIY